MDGTAALIGRRGAVAATAAGRIANRPAAFVAAAAGGRCCAARMHSRGRADAVDAAQALGCAVDEGGGPENLVDLSVCASRDGSDGAERKRGAQACRLAARGRRTARDIVKTGSCWAVGPRLARVKKMVAVASLSSRQKRRFHAQMLAM